MSRGAAAALSVESAGSSQALAPLHAVDVGLRPQGSIPSLLSPKDYIRVQTAPLAWKSSLVVANLASLLFGLSSPAYQMIMLIC